MNFIQFPLAVILLWQFITTENISTLSVLEISKFPNAEDSPFNLQILPEPGKQKSTILPTETMVVTIRDKNQLVLEKHIFNYGIQYSIDEKLIGNFINILKWQRDINTAIIDISILFKKNSDSKFIEIFHLPSNSIESRRKMLKNLKLANLLYSSKIDIFVPSKLELSIKSIRQSNDESLFPNEIAIAACRAYDGIPKIKPMFTNHKSFNIIKSEYNSEVNERKLWVNVSITDHLKKLTCNVKDTFKSATIHVVHNPSMIYINPEIGEAVQTNQTILCFTKDGYPKPLLRWNFISGPSNASMFYEINQTKLHIKTNSPVESIWKFYCSANNKTHKILNKTISFLIRKKTVKMIWENVKIYFDNNLRKIESLETFINNEIKSIKGIINKLVDDTKNFIQMKNNEITNISQTVNILNRNQYLIYNISNTKINQLTNSIGRMKLENELLKGNNQKQIDMFANNSNRLFQSLIEKNDRLNGSIQLIIKNMTIKTRKVKYQASTIPSVVNKQYKLLTKSHSQFDWIIDDFSPTKLKINFISFSDIKYDDVHNFDMDIWYWFYRNGLRIYFYIKSLPFTNQLNSTVQIINKNNEQHYVKMTKGFTVSEFRSPYFVFNYEDLIKSGVLKGNSIIIRCNLIWNK